MATPTFREKKQTKDNRTKACFQLNFYYIVCLYIDVDIKQRKSWIERDKKQRRRNSLEEQRDSFNIAFYVSAVSGLVTARVLLCSLEV